MSASESVGTAVILGGIIFGVGFLFALGVGLALKLLGL